MSGQNYAIIFTNPVLANTTYVEDHAIEQLAQLPYAQYRNNGFAGYQTYVSHHESKKTK